MGLLQGGHAKAIKECLRRSERRPQHSNNRDHLSREGLFMTTYTCRWGLLAILLVAVGATGAVLCRLWHFCECGHMAHDPFSTEPLHHSIDYAWTLASIGAAVTGFRFRFGVIRWLSSGLVVLAIYRYTFETVAARESWLGFLPYPI